MLDPRKKKRVLWLLNHTTLMEFEVKLLLDMGFEVYVPKITPSGPNGRTATVVSHFDSTLTIPAGELARLNECNFYEDPIPKDVVKILNRRFATGFTSFIFPGCYYFTYAFLGTILIRVFGHAGDMNYELATTYVPPDSYYGKAFDGRNRILRWLSRHRRNPGAGLIHDNPIMRLFKEKGRSLLFAACYENMIPHEPGLFRRRGVYLPLGIPDSILEKTDAWRGGDPRILFVCPNINEIPYYRRFYDLFVKNFGHLPYAVAGKQSLPGTTSEKLIDDPNILGFQSREDFDALMAGASCMFYHSQEPRHLHYHPLEAIVYGLPLIYMSGGLLERFGGPHQPGLCRSYEEARSKIERLVKGDRDFIAEVKAAQTLILTEFTEKYCREQWERNFLPVLGGIGDRQLMRHQARS